MKFSKKVIVGTLAISLFTGGLGVYAGTILEQYKTPRGNIATVEQEKVHKNRVGVTVNGKSVSADTWYANGVTYIPLRDVYQLVGASVNYDTEKLSADIVTESELLNLLGLKIRTTYHGHLDDKALEFKITHFYPGNNHFGGTVTYGGQTFHVMGTISKEKMAFTETDALKVNSGETYLDYELTYNGAEKKFTGGYLLSNGSYTGGPVTISLD